MQTRLNQLSMGIDRTADMGPFPHDQAAKPLVQLETEELIRVADSSEDATQRDQAMWEAIYRETPDSRSKDLPEFLYSVATEAKEPVMRRSGSWGLLKLGEVKLLEQSLRNDDDGNTHSWKQNLIYESQGRSDWVDPRPVRVVESELGYATTLPLTIHGVVQFREYKYGARADRDANDSAAPYRFGGAASRPPAYGGSLNTAAGYVASTNPNDFDWYSFAAGPIAQRRLVGDLTAAVGQGSFYDNLSIQKVCTDPLGNGLDHVQGYLFQGMSRSLGGNAFAHYYTSRGPQPFYLSGRIGDASIGVVEVDTQLSRHAETYVVTNANVPYPYVQSVRGLFFGPANMNTWILRDDNTPIDNLLQIVREPYANGWFFGEFRSVLVDVDGDGQVEVNGMEMYTDLRGNVINRTPEGPQPSRAFAR